jgi:coenzyme PQQ precursor peptide PqqA
MTWKTPKIVEVQVGMEINMYVLRGAQVISRTLARAEEHILACSSGSKKAH